MFVIDYVIVHELAHLLEANHTPRFWNIVRAQTPSAEKARGWLKENGQLLEEGIQPWIKQRYIFHETELDHE